MAGNDTKKSIIQTTIILTIITIIEFTMAFLWPQNNLLLLRNGIYGILTLVKAFFIVAVFMHLGGEVRRLALTIIIPFIFILWLIIGLALEGGYWGRQDKKTLQGSVNPVRVEAVTVA